jgi:glycolate oxidase FAD binding subunit
VFAPLPEPLLRLHRAVKATFDPGGIFNPGRMYRTL